HEIYKTNTKAICDKLETRLKAAEGENEKRKKWMDVELGKYHLSDDQALGKKGDSND
ncbi:hypothetical protein LCGC14_2134660, partial [marine sediment metagenome]